MSAMGPGCKKNVSGGAAEEYTFADWNDFFSFNFYNTNKNLFFLQKFELFSLKKPTYTPQKYT